MMSETTVENQLCEACGTEVRAGALFCYHCGGPVSSEIVDKGKNNHLGEISVDGENDGDLSLEFEDGENKKSKKSVLLKEKGKSDIKLKSAASIRNRARRIEPQKIEIIWEEHENAPNLWFILVAVLLVVFAALIFFLALYLK